MPTRAGRWTEISALFDELVEASTTQRARRLAEIARDDPELAAQVQQLLDADAAPGGLLDTGAALLPARIAADGAAGQEPADSLAGVWRLLHKLGEGGMGVVWLAERTDGAYEQRVAVKLLKRGMDSHAILQRFLQERRILARLAHAHIVRLIDGGMSSDGRPYYVMDCVDGEPITTYAARRHLDVAARVALLATVAEAVAYAHTQLVVHRDLKPSNVLVDGAGAPRVLDFGIAKLLEESGEQSLTGTGTRVLSPAYAAPEQILGEAIGTPTDVYALGLMLCELLVGELPRRRSTAPAQLAHDAAHETSARASTLAGQLPNAGVAALYGADFDARRLARALSGDLDIVIATALQRDPQRRYPTAAAFADDLRRWLDRRPITARAESAAYRVGRFVRRHRLGVAAAALIAVSLLGGLGVALWQADQARQQAQLARQQAARAERVKAFLVDIFRQNDPAIAKGAELSAAQILRRGRSELDAALANDPATRGELLVTIAEIQGNLGAPNDGITTAEQGVALLTAQVPADDARLAQARAVRGQLYGYLDRHAEAERDLRSALAILAAQAHPDPEQVERDTSILADVASVTQSPAAAVELQRSVVEGAAKRLGEASPVLADYRISLAIFLEEAGDYAQAEEQYRRALPVLTTRQGSVSPRACEAQRNYAGLLDRLGRSAEAEPRFTQALACFATLYGTDTLPYARTLFSRAILLLTQRRYAEAEADLRKVLATPGDSAHSSGHTHRYLGRVLDEQGNYRAAADEYAQAEQLYRAADLPHDIQRWRARADYGYALYRLGDTEHARVAVAAALAGLDAEKGGTDVPEYMRPLRAQGEIARAAGDLRTALAAHRRWHALAKKLYGADSRDAYQAAWQLGLDLVASGDAASLAEAAALFESALALARKDAAPELAQMQRSQRDLQALTAAADAHATGR